MRVQGRYAGEPEGIRPLPRATFCYSLLSEPAICRRCARCRGVLRVTPQDELVCPRCGRVKAWTVSLNELGGILEDLRQGHAPVRGTRQTEDLITALEAEELAGRGETLPARKWA